MVKSASKRTREKRQRSGAEKKERGKKLYHF
jgi:hypothetical protein